MIGFKTKTDEIYWQARMILFMQFINTAIIILLMGAKLDFMPWIGKFFDGSNRDFTFVWYRIIGSIYVSTMIIFSFQGVIEVVVQILKQKLSRAYDQSRLCNQEETPNSNTKCKTVWQYYNLYAGDEFLLETKYAFTSVVVILCFMFGPGMPILFPIGFLTLSINYFVLKYQLAYLYRKPIRYSESINKLLIKNLSWLPTYYSAVGFWVYSNR